MQIDPILLEDLATRIRALADTGQRRLIAIAGPPASGKSVLAAALCAHLNLRQECATVIPLDGFHLDNRLLSVRGLLPRKGAPETFDAHGFVHLVSRLRTEPEVVCPVFDRSADIAIAGAEAVRPECAYVILEGNYLLFDEEPWRGLGNDWDLSIRLDVPEDELRERLLRRWRDHGLSEGDAVKRCEENDLPNARRVALASLPADLRL